MSILASDVLRSLRRKLEEMALVEETGDSHDEGYMAAVEEITAWMKDEDWR